MKKLRTKDYGRLAAVISLVAAVVVIEMVNDGIQAFYKDHPLQAGVITGVLLSVAAYFGFDAVRAELTEHRWRPLSKVALLALKYQTTLLFDTVLWLVTARPPINDARPTRDAQRELAKIRKAAGLSPPRDLNLATITRTDYEQMLRRLIGCRAWRDYALHAIDEAKWRHRDGIAAWAAPMLTTGVSADVLNRLATLNEWSSELQLRLNRVQPERPEIEPVVEPVVEDWMDWLSEAVSLREDLVRASRGQVAPADQESRKLLTAEDARAIAERDEAAGREESRQTLITPFKLSPVREA